MDGELAARQHGHAPPLRLCPQASPLPLPSPKAPQAGTSCINDTVYTWKGGGGFGGGRGHEERRLGGQRLDSGELAGSCYCRDLVHEEGSHHNELDPGFLNENDVETYYSRSWFSPSTSTSNVCL